MIRWSLFFIIKMELGIRQSLIVVLVTRRYILLKNIARAYRAAIDRQEQLLLLTLRGFHY